MTAALRREALVEIASAAAAIVAHGLSASLEVDLKQDGTPVTKIDRELDAFLRRELEALLPIAGWLSEETADDRTRLGRELTWIVDPLDGTKELVAGRSEIAISIGLVRRGRPVAAVVCNPLTGESGSWVEGSPPRFEGLVAKAEAPSLAAACAIVSRTETEDGVLDDLGALFGGVRPVGSVAYKLLRVASGADDLTFSVRPKSEWDVCGGAGLLLASERAFLRLDGRPGHFNASDTTIASGTVAGPLALAAELRDLLVARIGGPFRPR